MKKIIYFPKVDCVVTIFFTLLLGYSGGLTLLNDTFWVYFIYILSLGLTNLNKVCIRKLDINNEKKRKKYQRKHINNPRSNIKNMPRELLEIERNYDYDFCFNIIKFLLGMITVMFLAIISSVNHLQSTEFGEFTFYFYIDAFLLPLFFILLETFMYQQSILQALKELLRTVFYKKGRLRIIKGLLCMLGLLFMIVIALIYTMNEFVLENGGIFKRLFF